jgi:phage terminase large subunit-like protein
MQWVPRCNLKWSEPWHLGELVDVLERAPRGGIRALVSEPIRHYKTSTVLAAVSLWMRRDPSLRVIYMTYSIGRSVEIGKELRDLCKRMGVRVDREYDTIASWRTVDAHGGVDVMSAQQSRLGADVDVLIVDDPFESDHECERIEVRDAVDKTIEHYTMRLSRGGSVVLVMSRFHVDDAIGRRLLRTAERWTHVHKRAIEVVDGVEVALAPAIRTVKEMAQIRAALRETDPFERLWWAQWQNEPISSSGDDDFRSPARYLHCPSFPGFVDAIGLDMAYSSSKRADWFALVVARISGGQMFVREVQRFRANEGVAENVIRTAWEVHGYCQIFSYMAGPEIGAAHYLASRGIHVNVMPARFNKRIRARKTIDRVAVRDLLLPQHAPWVAAFERRLLSWRGLDSDEDDEIDALVSVHDGAFSSSVTTVVSTCGTPRI